MSTASSITYLQLKAAEAQKLGRNGGGIGYLILTDAERQRLYFTITANSGGGYYSAEIFCLDAIERCLPDDRNLPIAAKVLANAFVGKSANNPSFAAAILRSEGLLGPVENKPSLHQVVDDWSAWKSAMLSSDGTPYVPPVKAGQATAFPEANADTAAMTREDMPGPVEADERLPRHKGKKGRVGKLAEGHRDASAA